MNPTTSVALFLTSLLISQVSQADPLDDSNIGLNLKLSDFNDNSNENNVEAVVGVPIVGQAQTSGPQQTTSKPAELPTTTTLRRLALTTTTPQPPPPTCTNPTPGNGKTSCSDAAFNIGTTCQFSCDSGYKLNGSVNATCLSTVTWSSAVPACEPITCPAIAAPTNGASSCDSGEFAYNSMCSFSCDFGFTLSNTANLTCGPNETWSDLASICSRVQCLESPPSSNFTKNMSKLGCTDTPFFGDVSGSTYCLYSCYTVGVGPTYMYSLCKPDASGNTASWQPSEPCWQ